MNPILSYKPLLSYIYKFWKLCQLDGVPGELFTTNSDFITPRLDFGGNFDSINPTRDSYTDLNSLYINMIQMYGIRWLKNLTEVHEISVCAANLYQRRLIEQLVRIYSDSQAAIYAWTKPQSTITT